MTSLPCLRATVKIGGACLRARTTALPKAKKAPIDAGDVWSWTAIDADTKLLCSFYVGDRTNASARPFIADLAERLANRVQLTSDGHRSYLVAVREVFGQEHRLRALQKNLRRRLRAPPTDAQSVAGR